MSRGYNIFISILALAAVSCTKSDIVGPMSGNDEIGFETYLGRDAQTKATVATAESLRKPKGQGIGIYGFYTGAGSWTETTAANILINENLYYEGGWKYDKTAYWVNNKDKYSFLAYAPYGNSAVTAKQEAGKAPQIEYNVPDALGSQVDLVFSNTRADANGANGHVNMVRPSNGTVSLNFQHALSRITVKANAVMYNATGGVFVPGTDTEYGNTFTVTNIRIKGPFKTEGTFDLSAGDWIETTTTENKIYDLTGSVNQELDADYHDFSGNTNYLMMIPADFRTTKAKLMVTYKVTYAGLPSGEVTKEVEIAENFEIGRAYSINLTFQRDNDNPITFKVNSLSQWEDEEIDTPTTPVENS